MIRFARLTVVLTLLVLAAGPLRAQTPEEIQPSADSVLLVILLRHTQERTLDEMSQVLRSRQWLNVFPPEGVRILGWYMLMGVGHLVLLEVPPAKIREVNRALESVTFGVFHVEVHPAYDFLPVIQALKEKVYNRPQ